MYTRPRIKKCVDITLVLTGDMVSCATVFMAHTGNEPCIVPGLLSDAAVGGLAIIKDVWSSDNSEIA